jgi:integrase
VRNRGTITQRGSSYRVKVELPADENGKRNRLQVTCKSKAAAKRELTRLLRELDTGMAVAPDKITIAQHLHAWLWEAPHGLAPKTVERYRQLANQQIFPHLGRIEIQKLRPRDVKKWHGVLIAKGLSARTVGHAHRLLHKALADAHAVELVGRNVASVISPPTVGEQEIEILTSEDIRQIHSELRDHWLRPIFMVALGTGIRRGELLALRWSDVGAKEISVERSLEQTRQGGLRFKGPKTRYGRRTVPLPGWAIAEFMRYRKEQLERCMALGAGRPELVFTTIHGEPIPPNNLSRDWARTIRAKKLPKVSFHALRHTHASILLVADRLDVLTVSRRLGHRDASITLRVYGHLLDTIEEHVKLASVLA